ncbi:MAG: gliding motility-associated C-terminal domain-containing protein [Lewinellaceae bacterium]|nr:gliding motility-associated C-terminal domain-containing protein [Lewinellaceae bacterium]
MQKKLLALMLLLLAAWGMKAQLPPPCPANDYPPADLCSDICIYCNFNGITGNTGGYTGQTPPGGFCSGIQNELWLGFIAGAAAGTFTVTPANCQNGNGLQIALYTSCNDAPIACNGGQQGGGNTPMSITSQLTPGVNYYLLIDGYGGDICDYTVTVVPPSAVQAPSVGNTGSIAGPITVCPGATVTYSIPVVSGAGAYEWNGPPGSLINGMPPPVTLDAPGGNVVSLTMGPNSGQICVKPLNSCNDGVEVCRNIISQPILPTTLPPVIICNEDAPYILPWGDPVFNNGLYETTYQYYQGCDSIVRQNVTIKPPIVRFLPPQTVCAGTCVTICNEEYCDAGSYTHTCESFQGCDSIIPFAILILDPIAEIIPGGVISCANDTITLTSTASPGAKVWKNLSGTVLGTGNSLLVTQPGTIVLTVTASAGGALCTASDTITVTGDKTPPTVSANGGFLGCGNAQAQITTATNAVNPAYAWSPANGLSATNIPNPIATLPGIYTVTVTTSTNGCTATATVSITGNTDPPQATATGATITCVLNPVTISATTDVPNATFAWSGPAGFGSSEQSPSVGTAGTYTVVITNPANSCTASATASVMTSTTPPGASAIGGIISCNAPSVTINGGSPTNGVTFSWTGPNNFASTLEDPSADLAGAYTVTVTDPINGCTSTASTTLTGNTIPPTADAIGGTVSCGDPNLTLDGSSNTPGVTFGWSGPNGFSSSQQDPIVTVPGLYVLTVTGPNACTSTAEATVDGDFAAPDAAATGGVITCSASNTVINGSSNSPNVTFTWVGPNGGIYNGPTPTVSNTGTYTLTVTSPNGCTATATADVVPDANVPNASAVGGTLNCLVFNLMLDGGSVTPGVMLEWTGPGNFNSTLEDPSVDIPGTYTLVVTNPVNGCTAVATANVVLDDAEPGASAIGGTVTCDQPDIEVSGDSPANNVTWAWSGPNGFASTEQNPMTSEAGDYALVVTALNGCTSTALATVIADQAPPVPASTTGTLTCSITSIVLNGTADVPVTFSWLGPNNFNSSEQNPAVSESGDYTLLTTALNGCTADVTVTVLLDVAPPDVSASGNTISCSAPQVSISGASATPGATFQWLGPNSFNSPDPNPLVDDGGAYTLVVTAPNGCTSDATVDVLLDTNQPLVFASAPDVLTCSTTSVQVSSTATNASSPVQSYSWSGPGGFVSVDEDPLVSEPGEYTVVVTSANGCTATASATATQDIVAPDISAQGGTLTCLITEVDLDGNSSTPGASFSWSGPGFTSTLADPTINVEGDYTLTVTGPNGCTASETVVVILDGDFPDAAAASSNNLDCDDLATTLTGISITPDVAYAWSDNSGIFAVTPTTTVSGPGTYQLAVTAPNGCVTLVNVDVSQDINEPGASAQGDTINCITGESPILGGSPTTGVAWLWAGPGGFTSTEQSPIVSQPGIYTLTVTAPNACTTTATAEVAQNTDSPDVLVGGAGTLTCLVTELTLTGQINTPGATGLWTGPGGAVISSDPSVDVSAPGVYTYTVTALNGCISAPTLTVGENVVTPQGVQVTGGLINCAMPTLTLSATSTTPNVAYSWIGPAGFMSPLQNPPTGTPGTYTVLLTNPVNGCQATAVTSVLGDFVNPTVSATSPTITCSVPSVTITSTGSPANISYKWTGPGINTGNESSPNPPVNAPGTYAVTVTAANGCTATTTVAVPADVAAPNAAATGVTLTCTQPSSTITGTSTTPGVTYAWSGPDGFASSVANPVINNPGDYVLTVTAPNGCTSTAVAVAVPDANAPTAAATGATITCAVPGVTLAGSSSLATVTWAWTGPAGFSSTAQNPSVDAPGNYTLVVTNPQNGCTASATTQVLADIQGPQVATGVPEQLDCTTTQVSLSATVQTPGSYSYQWSTQTGSILSGDQTPNPTVSTAAVYAVVVTNLQNGCTTLQNVTVVVDSSTVSGAELVVRDVSCFGRTDGGLNVAAVVGGTPPFLYSLDNAPFSAQSVFTGLPPGTHTVAIQDANGCEWETTFPVAEPEELLIELGPDTTIFLGDSIILSIDGVVNFPDRVVNTTLNPSYLDTLFGAFFTPPNSFRYTMTVVDANGCKAADSRLVIVDKTRLVYIPNVFDPGAPDLDALFFISAKYPNHVTGIKSFLVFDRWGNAVFERFNFAPNIPELGWDGTIRGTKAHVGVYTYFAEIEFIDGETILYKGDVTLLRNN